MFNSVALWGIGFDPSTLYPHVAPRPPPLPVGSNCISKPPTSPIPIRLHKFLKKSKTTERKTLLDEAQTTFLGSEEEEELRDALSPKYDQLKIKKPWWALEILPLKLRYQKGNNEWVSYIGSASSLSDSALELIGRAVLTWVDRGLFRSRNRMGSKYTEV